MTALQRNPHFKPRPRRDYSLDEYVAGIRAGDRVILSRAITRVESNNPAHQDLAQEIVKACLPYSGASLRVGITGVPGVGKSTFIEASGRYLIEEQGYRLAVLAIDPSSSKQGGSILGDKTRMQTLSVHERAFIRPSPSAGSLGGVARKTRESILLCEAAGYNLIFVETVGVGQSETAVYDMVDCFLLLMLSGAGDQLQGIKRGIMEMADLIAITKADGSNQLKARAAAREYAAAVHLMPQAEHGQVTSVLTCSALDGEGIDRVWQAVINFCARNKTSGFLAANRRRQARNWMHQSIQEQLLGSFYQNSDLAALVQEYETRVVNAELNPFEAARELLNRFAASRS
ncbi:MAG: methylmalonyl Co-A mutase-associated GTPase MeaB [Leptospiraceae bacterium]|nr:methylmalonyl Co-A mutase-associated GTPase MeaB [Leptospiraceae bacterium]